MTTITIRNVSPELRGALKEKAKRSGRSMQQIALEALQEKVERKSPEEWLREARETARQHGTKLGPEEILRAVNEERGDPYP
ncbi:MAG: hypothetical protein IPN07_15580 [Dehalococcoidia bacterium]|jgi:predicted transcriptional regulator|nr:hypothetical protein [Dehalococcoidia bacterium]